MTDAEKIHWLTEGLKQMLGAFDTPVSRRWLKSEFYEESRQFARRCYEKATSAPEEKCPCGVRLSLHQVKGTPRVHPKDCPKGKS